MAAGLAEQHAHQIFDEKALERPCSKGCHERRLNIHFLKRLEHVPVAKSDAKNAFFARRERNFSFGVPAQQKDPATLPSTLPYEDVGASTYTLTLQRSKIS